MPTTDAPARIDDLACWPETEADVTPAAILRALQVYALVYGRRSYRADDSETGILAAGAAVGFRDAATLLAALIDADPAAAQVAALDLWHAATDPAGPAELLWEALDRVDNGLAQQVIAATDAAVAEKRRAAGGG